MRIIMKASEAEKISIEQRPIYRNNEIQKALHDIYKRIEDAANEGQEILCSNLECLTWYNAEIYHQLENDGYYVRANSFSSYKVAWGEQAKEYLKSEEEFKVKQEEQKLTKKKWYQIF